MSIYVSVQNRPIFEFKEENPCLASGRALDEAADDAADPELVALRRRHHVQLSLIGSGKN